MNSHVGSRYRPASFSCSPSPLYKIIGLSFDGQMAVERGPESAISGKRRVDDGQTNFVRFDTICLAVKRRSKPADCERIDDGQTNFVSFDTICLAVECHLSLSLDCIDYGTIDHDHDFDETSSTE